MKRGRDGVLALELAGVTAGYGQEPVLKDVSLSVQEGQRLAVLGRNGSGKTTLLRVIAGLLPCSGTGAHLRRGRARH